jgi:2-oxoglutarate ferredoxin oxidoreductase subunit delta
MSNVRIDEALCNGCESCVAMCPRGILEIDQSSGVCRVTDDDKCDQAGGCEFACPTGAITINRP